MDNDTRLSNAILSGDIQTFNSLLAEDPFILDCDLWNLSENPLHVSSLAGQTEMTREIATKKPGFIAELNQDGLSPMHIASASGRLEAVKELLKVRNDVCVLKGKDDKTPLHCAAMKGRVDVVKELVSACPQCIKLVTLCSETTLHVAVKSNQFETVKVLIDELKKLDMMEILNWKDKDGNTILHLATIRKQHEIIELLIGKDAIARGVVDVNSINSSGLTPNDALDFVLQSGPEYYDFRIVEMFQHARAMRAKEIAESLAFKTSNQVVEVKKMNQNPILPVVASKSFTWNLWRALKKEIEESSTETQNALMVVAVLIATVTYQAVLSPPSGFWSADTRRLSTQMLINKIHPRRTPLPGEAVMAQHPRVFAVFNVFNALGFFASIAMISMLTSGFPLRAGLRLAMLSMTSTYLIAAFSTAPTEKKTLRVVVWLTGLIVVFEFARFMVWLLKKSGVLVPPSRIIRSAAVAIVSNQSSRV